MSESRSFLSPSVRLGGVVDVVIGLGLLATWIGMLARWHWFFALFEHFCLQGTLVCLLACAVFCIRKKWRLAVFAALSLAVNVWPLATTTNCLEPGVTADDSLPGLKVICFNALFSNTRVEEVRDYLVNSNADLIVLLEFSPSLEAALKPLEITHPHGVRHAKDSPWGIGCYSRLPFAEVKAGTFADETPPSIEMLLEFGGRKARIVATHPWPPTSSFANLMMHHQLTAINKLVASHQDTPSIVTGDFNSAPWSVTMRLLRDGSSLDYRTPKPVWRPTWNVHSPLTLAIDHALCTPQLFFEKREIGPDLGSDHLPQELLVRWAK